MDNPVPELPEAELFFKIQLFSHIMYCSTLYYTRLLDFATFEL